MIFDEELLSVFLSTLCKRDITFPQGGIVFLSFTSHLFYLLFLTLTKLSDAGRSMVVWTP